METNEIPQPQIRSTPYQSPMHNYGNSILYMTNPENELTKLGLTLRSEIMDDNTNALVQVGEPLLNEKGVNSVLGQVQAIVNQITIMSKLNNKQIPLLTDFLGDTLAKDLMQNRATYDIKTPVARDKIYFAALSTAFICMNRALDGGERGFWKGSQQEITTRVEGVQGKQSLFSRALGWKR